MKTYHVGILGFGFIGKVHAYGYAEPAVVLRSGAACGPDHPRRHQPAGDRREGPAD